MLCSSIYESTNIMISDQLFDIDFGITRKFDNLLKLYLYFFTYLKKTRNIKTLSQHFEPIGINNYRPESPWLRSCRRGDIFSSIRMNPDSKRPLAQTRMLRYIRRSADYPRSRCIFHLSCCDRWLVQSCLTARLSTMSADRSAFNVDIVRTDHSLSHVKKALYCEETRCLKK